LCFHTCLKEVSCGIGLRGAHVREFAHRFYTPPTRKVKKGPPFPVVTGWFRGVRGSAWIGWPFREVGANDGHLDHVPRSIARPAALACKPEELSSPVAKLPSLSRNPGS